MNPNTQRNLAILVLIILVIGSIFTWNRSHPIGQAVPTGTSTPITLSTTTASNSAVTIQGTSANSYTQPTAKPGVPVPDFKSPITCTLSAAACEQVSKQASDIVRTITKNKTDFQAWIDLGVLRKMNGDYKGASAAWEYVSAIYLKNTISFGNLGDLYLNFLHDEAKAEQNYLTEIKNAPGQLDAYRALFSLYSTGWRGGTAAEDILKKGISVNPKAVELQVMLARYYRSQNRTAEAQAAYAAAVAGAQSQGQAALAVQIQQEAAQ